VCATEILQIAILQLSVLIWLTHGVMPAYCLHWLGCMLCMTDHSEKRPRPRFMAPVSIFRLMWIWPLRGVPSTVLTRSARFATVIRSKKRVFLCSMHTAHVFLRTLALSIIMGRVSGRGDFQGCDLKGMVAVGYGRLRKDIKYFQSISLRFGFKCRV
jgi:hypothetical protein